MLVQFMSYAQGYRTDLYRLQTINEALEIFK